MAFFSIPGMRPHQRENSGAIGPGYRGPLPENPLAEEFLRSRAPTSHGTTGLEPDDFLHFRGDVARVEGEEKDQHSGKIEQYIQRHDPTGSGTHRVTWEPNGPRGMIVTDIKRVHE